MASSLTPHVSRFLFHVLVAPFLLSPATAQVHGGPVSQQGGPLSGISTNVGNGSRPVHEPGRSVRDSSAGPLTSGPVRGSVTGNILSGPVSAVSSGPMTEHRPVSGGGPVSSWSAEAIADRAGAPPGEPPPEPLTDLGALQEELRAVQPLPLTPGAEPSLTEPSLTEPSLTEPEPTPEQESAEEQPADSDESRSDSQVVTSPPEEPLAAPEAEAAQPPPAPETASDENSAAAEESNAEQEQPEQEQPAPETPAPQP